MFRLHTADDESQLCFACKAYYKVFKYHKSITGIHNLKEHPRRVRIPAEEGEIYVLAVISNSFDLIFVFANEELLFP